MTSHLDLPALRTLFPAAPRARCDAAPGGGARPSWFNLRLDGAVPGASPTPLPPPPPTLSLYPIPLPKP